MPAAASARLALTSPLAAEGNNVPADLATLITQLEARAGGFLADLFANRPAAAASNNRFLFHATDTDVLYWSDGAAWWTLLGTTGGTLSGFLAMADNELRRPLLKDYGEEVQAHGATGSTETIDVENGNVHTITLDANCTLTFSNPTAAGDCCSFTLIVLQDATGSRAITWPASVKWPGGTVPTLTTTASRYDVFTFVTVDGGTRWFGFAGGLNFS